MSVFFLYGSIRRVIFGRLAVCGGGLVLGGLVGFAFVWPGRLEMSMLFIELGCQASLLAMIVLLFSMMFGGLFLNNNTQVRHATCMDLFFFFAVAANRR